MESQYQRIVTHDDFDGVVSAALVGYFMEIDNIVFAGPGDMTASRIPTGGDDIVCDLPFPLQAGMWFDHHEANLDEIRLRGIEPEDVEGRVEAAPSCARVIRDYFAEDYEIEEDIERMVAAADRIDSFAYSSIEDWRSESPERVVDEAIKLKAGPRSERMDFLRWLATCLMDEPLETVAAREEVAERSDRYRAEEEQMLSTVEKYLGRLDEEGEIALIDLSGLSQRVNVVRNLAQLLDPDALAVLEVKPLFDRQGMRTNSLSFSMSMTIRGQQEAPERDLGEIMRTLDIGSGHPGAASGRVDAESKAGMLLNRQKTMEDILAVWRSQAAS